MQTTYADLTPKFVKALSTIMENNMLEKITVRFTRTCVTFYYAVKTAIKDYHRDVLKKDHCDHCITNVVLGTGVTHIRAMFTLDSILSYSFFHTGMCDNRVIELDAGIAKDEALVTFNNALLGSMKR